MGHSKVIQTEKTLKHVFDSLKNGDITIRTNVAKMYHYDEVYIEQIAEPWRDKMTVKKIHAFEILDQVIEMALFNLLNKKVDFPTYRKSINKLLNGSFNLSTDDIYERSIKCLHEVGFKF